LEENVKFSTECGSIVSLQADEKKKV